MMRMMGMHGVSAIAALIVTASAAHAQGNDAPRLLPAPASLERSSGAFAVADGATVVARGRGADVAARLLVARVAVVRGLTLRTAPTGTIRIERDAAVKGEGAYRLDVTPRGIRVAAASDAGLVHGVMTLAQLLSPDEAFGRPVSVPALAIRDAPRFRWRGYMADPARHFQPIAELYKAVDQMAALKLNVLHIHLSDDQGWRVEIKRYPKLTEIGAWRDEPDAGGAPGPRHGGFYTQDELRKLVAYAAERAITIVPEIDLPGHAQAIVAAYPDLGVFGDRPPVSGDWGVMPYLLDPGPKGVRFVMDVIDELVTIFPGEYVHLGGDEAVKDQWQRSPRVQALMRERGIKTENALQSALIREFDTYLRARKRRLIGWDEILDGGDLPQSAAIMSWQGEKGAIVASKAGHDVVLSPAPILYLDNIQAWLPGEPPMRPANPAVTLERVYGYDAMPAAIAPADRHHVLGAQVNGWSEYLTSAARVDWALYPRLAAFAEGAWSPTTARDFRGFLTRLEPQVARWRREGVGAADSAFAVAYRLQVTRAAAVAARETNVALSSQTGHGTIRYTLDGSAPTAASPAYAAPLSVKPDTMIRATTFASDGLMLARARDFATSRANLLLADTNDLSACSGGIELRFGASPDAAAWAPAYNSNFKDLCMTWRAAPLSVARGFDVSVGRLPRNLGLAHAFDQVKPYYPATEFGELVVRAGGCSGMPVGTFPLPDPATAPVRMRFAGELPRDTPDGDLCMTFTAPVPGPIYAIDAVQLK